ncbi:GAF domain-containing protein, partial [Pseudomonas sp. BGM005]|nr:GAF domain-containing protein [Pseudomonas sp. BG5]
ERNTEQDWLKTNLARFTNMLQGQRDLTLVGKMLLSELAPLVGAHQGVIYQVDADESQPFLSLLSVYAQGGEAAHPPRLDFGQGLVGQCASDARRILVTDLPEN